MKLYGVITKQYQFKGVFSSIDLALAVCRGSKDWGYFEIIRDAQYPNAFDDIVWVGEE